MSRYSGASVSAQFTSRWRSKKHVASARPWAQVLIRRGQFERRFHWDWPKPHFGQILGRSIRHQWYPDWTPLEDWTELPGVAKIDLDQSFDRNGITIATLQADNVAWEESVGVDGMRYHARQRGVLWPWRGWVPAHRPGTNEAKNEWYNRLPNAQILIRQGYGADTAVKTFTGLIDNLSPTGHPDVMSITARDFGSVLVDTHVFGWNKDKRITAPITFIPHDYEKLHLIDPKKQRKYVVVKDVTDIVRCALRWCGFKEWEVENCGAPITSPFNVDISKTWADVISDVQQQLGYVFFIAEPSNDDDLSIGRPIFRPSTSVAPGRAKTLTIRGKDLLTDFKPVHDNSSDRYIIRVRGVLRSRKKGGVPLSGNPPRVTFTYWPPWMPRMAGVIKQLTYYNVGDAASVGFKTKQDCMVAAVLIAIQIALKRDTATGQTAGNPAIGLDGLVYVTDSGTGSASRVYVTNRKSTMTLGGSGSGSISSAGNELLWATEFGGSLIDNPEFKHLRNDYSRATHGKQVISWGTPY